MMTETTTLSLGATPAPAVILIGPPGSGKTDVLTTIIAEDLDLFVIGTETRFKESLLDSISRRKLDRSRLHTRLIQPLPQSFEALLTSAKLINDLSFEFLTKLTGSSFSKSSHTQFITLLQCLANFKDDDGKEWGPVDSWGGDRALALDGQSGLNLMALDLVVGTKPVRAPGEWGIAMDNLERLLNTLTSNVKCLFVLTAHPERETDEVTGGTSIQVGALGKKLAPKLPRFFSEVVHCRKDGPNYFWSTITPGYDLKKRVLPLSDKIEPSFKPIIQAWRNRG